MQKTILLNGSYAESLINFRGPLIRELVVRGHRVHVSAPDIPADIYQALRLMGATPHSVSLSRSGFGPIGDMAYWLALVRLIKLTKADLVIGYTIKPNIWGSLAARYAGVRSVSMITGLGYSFISKRGAGRWLIQKLARVLYRFATNANYRVIFQNPDDRDDFIAAGCLADPAKVGIVNGSGVDSDRFSVAPLPEPPIFLLIARQLWTKGIKEYVAAAQIVRRTCPDARFQIAGPLERGPDAAPQSFIDNYARANMEYLGSLADVRPAIAAASVYVLPSYREGTPRTVLEAMAMGRAIITTDAPGCRETTIQGVNGFLVPVGDVARLAAAMIEVAEDGHLRSVMGQKSRSIIESKYTVMMVNLALLEHLGLD